MSESATTFDLVSFYQYRENYGDAENPYFKDKGGYEQLVLGNISVAEAANYTPIELENLVENSELGLGQLNEGTEFWYRGCELVEVSGNEFDKLKNAIVELYDSGYPYKGDGAIALSYQFDATEHQLEKALESLKTEERI